MEQEFVEINGEKIAFYVQRKEIKYMNLRVTKDCEIKISLPKKMNIEYAKEFIKRKIRWIKKQQEYYSNSILPKESSNFENENILYILGNQYKIRLIPDNKNKVILNDEYIELYIKKQYLASNNYINNFYEKWLKQYALNIIKELVVKYQKQLENYKINLPEIEIKKRKSVWGTCIPSKNKVIFNFNIIKTPIDCVEYVVLHELSHFKYPNHSKDFYNFIAIFMPNWKERRRILNKEFSKII